MALEGLNGCRDPSAPVKHTGREQRAAWPAGAGHFGRDDSVRKGKKTGEDRGRNPRRGKKT